jgi:ribosome maturation factor RimP
MDYKEFTEEIKNLITPVLEQEGAVLVELNLYSTRGGSMLKQLVDKKYGGITIEECTRINSSISNMLEERQTFPMGYMLEVSSPGVDRPLKTKTDFLRCINKEIRLFLLEPINDKIELSGIIKHAQEDLLELDVEGESVLIPFLKISRGKQIIC